MQNGSQTEKYIRTKKWKKTWGELIVAVSFAFGIFLVINHYFFFVRIEDTSMENTFFKGTRIYFSPLKISLFKESDLSIYRGQVVALTLENSKKSGIQILFKLLLQKLIRGGAKKESQIIVRRIVAISGDTVMIHKKKLFVNQREIVPSWKVKKQDRVILDTMFSERDSFKKILIPQGFIFVMCDNWDVFSDSRMLGLFSEDQIIGKVYQ